MGAEFRLDIEDVLQLIGHVGGSPVCTHLMISSQATDLTARRASTRASPSEVDAVPAQDLLSEKALDQFDDQLGRPVPEVESRVQFHDVERPHEPGVIDHFHA